MAIECFVGVDLAWADSQGSVAANETGVAVIDSDGSVVDAGWTRGLEQTLAWIETATAGADALVLVDAPLVVDNPSGQRACERQVGQCYGRWQVSANTTNIATPRQAGVRLREQLVVRGWVYHDGFDGPPSSGRVISECYPYTTLVGVAELGYHHDGQRPRYKRKPKKCPAAQWRPKRAVCCDDLVQRLVGLERVDPPLRLRSHPLTSDLLTASPLDDRLYKHREDLIDAVICAWTAALWHRHGLTRCQVLGLPNPDGTPAATIIAPAVDNQRCTR
jgi:predicted RNase H-like nuclease